MYGTSQGGHDAGGPLGRAKRFPAGPHGLGQRGRRGTGGDGGQKQPTRAPEVLPGTPAIGKRI